MNKLDIGNNVIISLGGSLIVPKEINYGFLKEFKKVILKYNKRFGIITGGGYTARNYIQAISNIRETNDYDKDLIGIRATKINAELVRVMFSPHSYEKVIEDYSLPINTDKKIIVGSGWEPGCSSDLDAVYMAEKLNADVLINMSNIEYVYDKDPKKFADARKIEVMKWEEMEKIVGDKWIPGANLPFDPIATKKAKELNLKVVIISSNLQNFERLLMGEEFKGTLIQN